MALAVLRFAGKAGGKLEFDAELGTNRYFTFAIGDAETTRDSGFSILANRKLVSRINGPIANHPLGKTRFEVAEELFDKENRYIQLVSYRTADREGPAVSEIVKVIPGLHGDAEFPTIPLGMNKMMTTQVQTRQPVAFSVHEHNYSQAQFLNMLMPMLKNALPAISNMLPGIGNLIGNLFSGKDGAPAAPPVVQTLIKPETIQLLQQLLAQIGAAGAAPVSQPKSLAFGSSVALGTRPRVKRARQAGQVPPEYAGAMWVQAIAGLAQLTPLLEKVLTPETIKAVLDHTDPSKVIGAVTDSVKEIGKLAIDSDKQDKEHLRAINPGVDDPGLDKLLSELSLARSFNAPHPAEPRYRRVDRVEIDFTDITPTILHGRTRVAYAADRDLAFPVSVKTPRSIANAKLRLLVKEPATRKVVAYKTFDVANVVAGPLSVKPVLPRAASQKLRAGEEYLVCVYLTWKTKDGKEVGTSRTQLITIVGEFAFDRVEESKDLIPLNDVQKYREYWHRAWQGNFAGEKRRYEFECKYYYMLDPKRSDAVRMETVVKTDRSEGRKDTGRLKTGLVLTPETLNRLIPLISSEKQLTASELNALRTADFVNRFQHAARFRAELYGRGGGSTALWIYPVVKLQTVVLTKPSRITESGHVAEFAAHAVRFPMPALIHYIGTRSK